MKNFIRSLLFFWLTAVALAACGNIPGVSNTTTADTPPKVTLTNPANSTTGVVVNTAITATFSDASDAINSSTVNTTTFTVADSGGNVAGAVSYDSTNNIATFTPSANLSYNTDYRATISAGVKDSAGNAMASPYSWTFTTGEEIDTTPPTVLSKSPTPNAIGVAVNTTITATFSDASDSSTVNTTTFTVADSGGNVAGAVSYDSTNNIATFTPSANLSYNTDYRATISAGVKDSAGNAMATPYSWTFTTESTSTSGAPGTIDTTFGAGGIVTTGFINGNGYSVVGSVRALAFQSDGKVVVTGYSYYDSFYSSDFVLARYNTDGTLDTTFGTGGRVTTDMGGSGYANAIGIQSDGKIVAAGYSSNGNNPDFALVRYNTDGSLDTTFGTGGIVTTNVGNKDYASAVVIQSDGRVVAAGYSSSGSNSDFALVRYNTDGTLDTTFGTGGKVTTDMGVIDVGTAIAIQSDGKIVAAGYSSTRGNISDFALVRYSTDGTLDATFGTDGKVTTDIGGNQDFLYALGIQSDGKIIAAGSSADYTSYNFALVRYSTDGTLDTTFGSNGEGTTDIGGNQDFLYALGIQSDGKIIAAGYSTDWTSYYDFTLARYNTDGSLDTTFGTGGIVTTDIGGYNYNNFAYALGIQSDGKIVAAGDSNDGPYFTLVRYNTDGTLDTTFGAGGIVTGYVGSNDYASAVVIQSDGRVVAAGYSSNGNNSDFALVRYNTDGSLDATFGTGGKVTTGMGGYDVVTAIAIQSDGKIVAAGYSSKGDNSNFALVRYNTDGSLDATFGTGGKVITNIKGSMAKSLAIQSDGKIVAAGQSYSYSSSYAFALVRYNTDGTLDTAFGTDGKVRTDVGIDNDGANAVVIQSDGKIVAAGWADDGKIDYEDSDFALVRYNTDGTLDTTFGSGGKILITTSGYAGAVNALGIQSDGKIVAAGWYEENSEVPFVALVRFNTDGTFDTAFGTDGVASYNGYDEAKSLGIQSDGKILVAVKSYKNDDFALVRYNMDGTLDTTFGTSGETVTDISPTYDDIYALDIQSDGKIVAAGSSSNGSNNDFAVVRYWP